jgi:hypothetical protein
MVIVPGALVASFIAAGAAAPWSTHTKLMLLGATLEVAGIALLASDLVARPAARIRDRAVERTLETVAGIRERLRVLCDRR